MENRPFRFRFPWLSAGNMLRPTPEPQTPPPVQPTTTVPIQRPPFRPAGIAPAQAPPAQTQAPERAEPRPPQFTLQSASPSRGTTRTRAASVPQSPTRETEPRFNAEPASPPRGTTQTRGASVPPSPTRIVSESRLTSKPTSPSRATNQVPSPSRAAPQPRATSVPPSPTSQAQSAVPAGQQPQSPSRFGSQRSGQKSPKPSSPSSMPAQDQTTAPNVSQATTEEMPQGQPQLSASQQEEPKRLPVQPSSPVAATMPATEASRFSEISEKVRAGIDRLTPIYQPFHKKTEADEQKGATDELKTEEKTILGKAREVLTAGASSGPETKQIQEEKEDTRDKRKTRRIRTNAEQIKTVSSAHPTVRNSIIGSHQTTLPSNEEHVPLHKEIREDISRFVQKLGTGEPKQSTDEKPVSIITLAGENRGAAMHLGSESAKKEGSVHIHRGYKTDPDESPDGTTTDGETSSKGRNSKDSFTKEETKTKAYINSNVQSINNSMLFESKVSQGNPGVHVDLPTEPTKPSATPAPLEARKAESSITPAEKRTYEPTVRRRCLRGLFLEPSDSENDNPEKPRRHGCRYSCGEKSKDKDIGIF